MNKRWWMVVGWLFLCGVAQAEEPVTLNLQTCITQALAHNLNLKLERYNPQLRQLDVANTQATFGLTAGAESSVNQALKPATASFIEGASILRQNGQSYNFFIKQNLATGGNIQLRFENSISDSNSTRVDLNPAITPRLLLNVQQPLLRNAWNGFRQLQLAENNHLAARFTLKARAMDTVTDVQQAYWDLVLYHERFKVWEESYKITQTLLQMNQEKEKAGFMSRIDLLQTEARLASLDGNIQEAQRQLQNGEDRLKRLLNPEQNNHVRWQQRIQVQDKPAFTPVTGTFAASLAMAQKQRPDLQALQLTLSNALIQQEIAAQNQQIELNLRGNAGLESLANYYPGALSQLFSFQTYFVGLGLSLEMPVIGNTYDIAWQQARVQLERQQTALTLAQQQLVLELRQALRNLDLTAKRVAAAQRARELNAEQLKAQTEKLNLGLATNFQVIQFQNDYQQASLNEIDATIDYINAVNALYKTEGTLLEKNGIVWNE